jgi:hypothetical protein
LLRRAGDKLPSKAGLLRGAELCGVRGCKDEMMPSMKGSDSDRFNLRQVL